MKLQLLQAELTLTPTRSCDQGQSNGWTHQVVSERFLVLHVLQAELADPELGLLPIILWERREVPGVDLKVPNLDLIHVLHLGDLRRRRSEEETSTLAAYRGSTGSGRYAPPHAPSPEQL